ncbi:phage tail protein [Neobacillus sp. DY30]|uniref:phage tail protein n=1 Tax=Neobacillus sp. DY30 TaxID=3047871 RepID=UPI0024BFBAAE|nr:phage tail protein [Neobacillus sp. DY30]WHY01881.1 phage tail protein [Neobacillus sp. DY30]
MLTITDIAGNTEALSGYRNLKRYRNVSGEKTLAFFVLPTKQNAHSFPMVAEESIVEFGGESYRIKQLAEKSQGTTFYKEVVAVHTFFDLIDNHVYNLHNGSMTFQNALQFVLGGTGYTWAIVDQFYAQDFENFGDDNCLALFQELLKRYRAEFTLNGTHLTFRQKIGNATDFQFRYSYNVKTISRDVKTNNLSTYIKGYGKKNEDGTYVVESEYTSPNAAIFGIRHAKPVRDERYTTLEGLDARLVAELNDEPEVSITIDFADLRRAGYPYDVPGEGDDVFLIYEPMGIDVETRLTEVEEEYDESSEYPYKTHVTLANIRGSFIDQIIDSQKQIGDIIGSDGKIVYDVLDAAVKRATEALQSAQTELEFNNGIIARSKDNPNHLVLLNSAGVGISTDGGATFNEAITYLGVNTSLLTAGQIDANNITVRGGTETAYTNIDSNGLYVKGGAVQIERPDGYVSMQDGIMRNSFAIQGSEPAFQTLAVEKVGQFYRTNSNDRFENIQRFVFKHDSRYVRVICMLYADGGVQYGNIANAAFDVFTEDETTSIASAVVTESRHSTNQGYRKDILIDLGVPTGRLYVMYWRMWSSVNPYHTYGSVRYVVQEG